MWQLRVRRGEATAWATVGVPDPDSLSAPAKERASGRLDLFTGFFSTTRDYR